VTVKIPLRNIKKKTVAWALIDDADADLVRSVGRWYRGNRGYVIHDGRKRGAQGQLLLHRFLLGLEYGDPRKGDHINRNRLDNRRENLRIASDVVNGQNVSSHVDGTSRFRGVHWDKVNKKWRASAHHDGRTHQLGRFPTEEEAARVVSAYRLTFMPGAIEDTASTPASSDATRSTDQGAAA
jgi:hypothetical protein